jgi:hypothetical protein
MEMEIYSEMLMEFCQISIPTPPPPPAAAPPSPSKPSPRASHPRVRGQHLLGKLVMDNPDCCVQPEITHGPRGENAYCMSCGLCMKNRFMELDYVRLKTGVYYTKKRFYAPLTHFKEHLRRYMGARFTEIPQQVLDGIKDLNFQHADAYFQVKARLKAMKMSKLYKEIFTLIYINGGRRPNIDNQTYEKCVADFKVIMQKFLGIRGDYQRHSMPCNYMLLDMLLRQNGHEPYYLFPYLKNDKCRDRVMEIYSDLKRKTDGDNKCHQTSKTLL